MYSNALPEGYILNDEFRIITILGQGGFGITYLAEDINLKREVVIKEFLPQSLATRDQSHYTVFSFTKDSDMFDYLKKRFTEEARLLATLRHPNIVKVIRLLESNHTSYFVMDFEDGETLKDYLKKHNRLNEEAILFIVKSLLEGLKYVHSKGILHRDIAPDNIYLRKDGNPMLIDFGAARDVVARKTQTLAAIIKEGYSPPEQYSGLEQSEATDIYALGAVIYRMIIGKAPLSSVARQDKLMNEESDEVKDIIEEYKGEYSNNLLKATVKALEVSKNRRFQSAQEFLDAINKEEVLANSYESLNEFIMLAGSDKVITKDEESMILQKARELGLNESKAKECIDSAIKKYGWRKRGQKEQNDYEKTKIVDNNKTTTENNENNKKSNIGLILASIIGLAIAGFGGYYFLNNSFSNENNTTKAEVVSASTSDNQPLTDINNEEQKKLEEEKKKLEEEKRKLEEEKQRIAEEKRKKEEETNAQCNKPTIKEFLSKYLYKGMENNIDETLPFYNDTVSPYYSKSYVTISDIIKDKKRYISRFPIRYYRLKNIRMISDSIDDCRVSMDFTWSVKTSNGITKEGESKTFVKLIYKNSKFYISGIKDLETIRKSMPKPTISKTNNQLYRVVNVAQDDTLNLRREPYVTSFNKIGELSPNATNINLLYCKNNNNGTAWCKIEYGNLKGWAVKRCLAPMGSYSNRDCRVIKIPSDDTLNVRVDAGVNYTKIGELAYDATGVKVIRCKYSATNKQWCKVSHRFLPNFGWVRSKYLSRGCF